MAPRNIEELLYLKLMQSAQFHRFVRSIYAKVNGLPSPHQQDMLNKKFENKFDLIYHPTRVQRFNLWRKLFVDEFKRNLGFK